MARNSKNASAASKQLMGATTVAQVQARADGNVRYSVIRKYPSVVDAVSEMRKIANNNVFVDIAANDPQFEQTSVANFHIEKDGYYIVSAVNDDAYAITVITNCPKVAHLKVLTGMSDAISLALRSPKQFKQLLQRTDKGLFKKLNAERKKLGMQFGYSLLAEANSNCCIGADLKQVHSYKLCNVTDMLKLSGNPISLKHEAERRTLPVSTVVEIYLVTGNNNHPLEKLVVEVVDVKFTKANEPYYYGKVLFSDDPFYVGQLVAPFRYEHVASVIGDYIFDEVEEDTTKGAE